MKLCVPLFLALTLQACFSVGIPESTWDGDSRESSLQFIQNEPVLIVSDKTTLMTALSQESNLSVLGNQYLGLLPFTRLFMEHGFQSFALETLTSELIAQGSPVIITDEQSANLLELQGLTISFAVKEPSINVRDYFLSRKINFDAVLEACMSFKSSSCAGHNSGKTELGEISLFTTNISESEWVKKGTPTQISSFLSLSLKTKFREMLEELNDGKRYLNRPAKLASVGQLIPLIVELPSIDGFSHLGSLVADSFHSPDFPAFTTTGLARSIQRGMHAAALEAGYPVISLSNETGNKNDAFNKFTSDQTQRSIRLKTVFKIYQSKSSDSDGLVFLARSELSTPETQGSRKECHLDLEPNPSQDGALVRVLENAGRILTQTALGLNGSECR